MAIPEKILREVAELRPSEQAELIDQLVKCLDRPDAELDKLWAEEAESRLAAYQRGELKSISLDDVLAKYK